MNEHTQRPVTFEPELLELRRKTLAAEEMWQGILKSIFERSDSTHNADSSHHHVQAEILGSDTSLAQGS